MGLPLHRGLVGEPGGGSFAGTFERKEKYIWVPFLDPEVINRLAYTAACEAAGLARSINAQPAVRRNSEVNPTSQHDRGMY